MYQPPEVDSFITSDLWLAATIMLWHGNLASVERHPSKHNACVFIFSTDEKSFPEVKDFIQFERDYWNRSVQVSAIDLMNGVRELKSRSKMALM